MFTPDQTYLMEQVAERFRALSDPSRLRILLLLKEGERNVTGLTEALDLRQASVSKHLGILRRAGLVTSRRDGPQVLYRVADDSIYEMCSIVCDGILKQAEDQSRALGVAESPESDGAAPRPSSRTSTRRNSR